jgi:DNA adenine methylase
MSDITPLLKWAGGKRQLLDVLLSIMPKDFDVTKNFYHEPFLGGGALFFAISSDAIRNDSAGLSDGARRFQISDTNPDLVNFYKVVRDLPEELILKASRLGAKTRRSDFYQVRGSKPRSEVGRAARLLYLNKLCFNGLYRVNSKGEFNVPFGNYNDPKVVNAQQIRMCSRALNLAEIRLSHFSEVLNVVRKNDLVYFDPPYIPLSPTASFSSYSKEGFGESDQRELARLIHELSRRGVRVILSNSDTRLSREIFGELNLFSVSASRAISATAKGRGKVRELLAVNFATSEMVNPDAIRDFLVR